MKEKLFSLAVLLFTGIITFSGCKEEPIAVITADKPESTSPLISSEVLRQAELELVWAHAMPLSGREVLREISIIEDRLYAVSSCNYLMSFDLEKAVPVYAWKLAPDAFKMCGIQKYNEDIYSILMTDLVVMDWREGTKKMSKRLNFGPLCAPVRNADYYYIAGTDQRIHVFTADNLVQIFEASANDNSNIIWVNANNDSVIFSTGAGNIAAMKPDEAIQIWKFKAENEINHNFVRDSKQVVFSSKDAYVYSISEKTGKLNWKYLTGALLDQPPVATETYVYQYAKGEGLLAIDRQSGKLVWQLKDGKALLSEKGSKTYVMTNGHQLVVMDSQKKIKISEIELPAVNHWVSNVQDDKIYLADSIGRIVCIKPIQY